MSLVRASRALLCLLVVSSCTAPPLDTAPTASTRFSAIPTATSAGRTAGIAPIARVEGAASMLLDGVALDGGALTFVFSGFDQKLHLGRIFPQGDLQDLPLAMGAQSSPWSLGLAVGSDGSRWIGLFRSIVRVGADNTVDEIAIPAARPPGLAAEAGRNGEVTAIAIDDDILYLGRAGIPTLTRLERASGRTVGLALPSEMPDVGTIARGPGGDFFLAASHRGTRFAAEPTARMRHSTGALAALPFRADRSRRTVRGSPLRRPTLVSSTPHSAKCVLRYRPPCSP